MFNIDVLFTKGQKKIRFLPKIALGCSSTAFSPFLCLFHPTPWHRFEVRITG